jgi:hypothetical protein
MKKQLFLFSIMLLISAGAINSTTADYDAANAIIKAAHAAAVTNAIAAVKAAHAMVKVANVMIKAVNAAVKATPNNTMVKAANAMLKAANAAVKDAPDSADKGIYNDEGVPLTKEGITLQEYTTNAINKTYQTNTAVKGPWQDNAGDIKFYEKMMKNTQVQTGG